MVFKSSGCGHITSMSKLFGMACEHAPTLGLFEHSCRRLLKQYMIRTTYCNPFRIAALTNRLSKQRTIATSKLNYKLQTYTHTHRMVERGRRALCTRACRSSTWGIRGTHGERACRHRNVRATDLHPMLLRTASVSPTGRRGLLSCGASRGTLSVADRIHRPSHIDEAAAPRSLCPAAGRECVPASQQARLSAPH